MKNTKPPETSSRGGVNRREFLTVAAASAASAATATAPSSASAQQIPARPAAPVPSRDALTREDGPARPSVESRFVEHPTSDFMVDVLKTLDFEYVAANPGSTFESLHESLINYGGNEKPELLTCLHEESAIGMAHGYAKVEGKPMMVMLHGTVGLMHGSMAIYNAYADRVPVYMIVGNYQDPHGIGALHSAQDLGSLVRDYTKWDAESLTAQEFAASAVRAYQFAMTPPLEPVLLVADHDMMGRALPKSSTPRIPKLSAAAPPQGDAAAVRQAATYLLAAQRPLITTERYARTSAGVEHLVELAELLGTPVSAYNRLDFPWTHPLHGRGGAGYSPDVILALEVNDMANVARRARASGGKSIGITAVELFHDRNMHDYGRYAELDLTIAADAETTVPALIEEVRRQMKAGQRRAIRRRAAEIAVAHRKERSAELAKARYGWNASPISLARLSAELWAQVKHDDWSLVSRQGFLSGWPGRIWKFEKRYHYLGDSGAGGMGYGPPASVGAALANRKHGRLSINIQCDGDLNYAPGVLWTAAHHKIPLLIVMHNNRAYHAELMFIQENCGLHRRGANRAGIGTTLQDPFIDYASMARAYGLYGEGPISDPAALAPAFERALSHVRAGEPALVDVITEPR